MKIHMVILSGGIGQRMGNAEIPKQFLTIGQSPIIVHTILRVMESELFDGVYIVVHPDWMDYMKKLLLKNGIKTDALNFIPGGKERIDSTQNALKALQNKKIDPDDIVVIHDGVRPFISRDLLLRCIDKTKQHGATVATVPVKDTLMTIEQGIATGTPDRKKLFHSQTPTGFKFSIIYDALQNLSGEERQSITGTAQICQTKGVPVYAYPGEECNIKITTPADLILGEKILETMKA